jgi:hypothetical protein
MEQKTEHEELTTKYLLGRLSEEEREFIEQKFLDDSEFFEQLLAAESALTDQYIQGNLSGDDRKQFEKLMNSSRLQQQEVEFTRDLFRVISSTTLEKQKVNHPPQKPHFFRINWTGASTGYALLAGFVLLIVFAAGMLMWSLHLRNQVTQLRGELDEARAHETEIVRQLDDTRSLNEKLAAGLNAPGGNESKTEKPSYPENKFPVGTVATIALTPVSINRGSKTVPVFKILPAIQTLRFQLGLPDVSKFDSYAVEIKTFEGKVIRRRDGMQLGNDKLLVFDLPANTLPNNDYIIILQGSASGNAYEDIQDYPFTLRR